jgi:hypothetical protein
MECGRFGGNAFRELQSTGMRTKHILVGNMIKSENVHYTSGMRKCPLYEWYAFQITTLRICLQRSAVPIPELRF